MTSPENHEGSRRPLIAFGMALTLLTVAASEPPRAARSVHLGWQAPPGDRFYLEMTVAESTAGSYFMACGWNTGYFGIQQLWHPEQRVAIFSVWDPTPGDDPNTVNPEDRVELLHRDPDVRIKRFGGEGTGGQCMMDYDWKIDQAHRFLVQSSIEDDRTAYAGFLWMPEQNQWKHLVTFRTRTGGQPLKGYYSFVEDFRRDSRSVHDRRRAHYSNGWVRTLDGRWLALTQARFTASGATWESKHNIDAGSVAGGLYLATGGPIEATRPLRSILECPLPDLFVPLSWTDTAAYSPLRLPPAPSELPDTALP